MDINDFIIGVFYDVKPRDGDKFACIAEIVRLIREQNPFVPDITSSLVEREHHKHTAVGNKVALPRSFRSPAPTPLVAVATLSEPICWDGQPVELVIVVAAPEKSAKVYFKLLVAIARLLQRTKTPEEVLSALGR